MFKVSDEGDVTIQGGILFKGANMQLYELSTDILGIMLDSDLASFYGVETKQLNRVVNELIFDFYYENHSRIRTVARVSARFGRDGAAAARQGVYRVRHG